MSARPVGLDESVTEYGVGPAGAPGLVRSRYILKKMETVWRTNGLTVGVP